MKDLHYDGTLFSIRACGPTPEVAEHWKCVLIRYKGTIMAACGPQEVADKVLDWHPSVKEITQESAPRFCLYLRVAAINAPWAKNAVLLLNGAMT